jgi:hypothetical protein
MARSIISVVERTLLCFSLSMKRVENIIIVNLRPFVRLAGFCSKHCAFGGLVFDLVWKLILFVKVNGFHLIF